MKVIPITTKQEIEFCIDIYLEQNDFSFINADRRKAIDNLDIAVRRKKFVKALEQDSKIVAWIYADILNSLHISNKGMQQLYYCSSLKGAAAYRAVKILHDELVNYTVQNEYEFVISTGSHLDENNVFTRILEKNGWERRGHIAIYKTRYYNQLVR